jgi:hypothetical protein
MKQFEFSEHASDMLKERNIKKSWVELTLENPDLKEEKEDGSIHYIKVIKKYGQRYLRVVVNPTERPQKIITLFFDRRLRRLT